MDGCVRGGRLPCPLHSPPTAAAPTGCLGPVGNQEGADRCLRGPGCPWTPERLSPPAQGSGPGGCGAGRRCRWPPRRGRRRRWRSCHHSCGQRPPLLGPHPHSAPQEAPAGEMGPGTGATPWSRAGKGDSGAVSGEGGQGKRLRGRGPAAPLPPSAPPGHRLTWISWISSSALSSFAFSSSISCSMGSTISRSFSESSWAWGRGRALGSDRQSSGLKEPQACAELSLQAHQLF